MKVFILACFVALALAREKEELNVSTEASESLSSSEESITHIKKLEKVKHEEQQLSEDELQDKIHPIAQPQLPAYPYAQPIPYAVLPQNYLPLAQLAMAQPLLQPEIAEVPKVKETTLSKFKLMPFLKPTTALPFFNPQIPILTDLENQHLPLPQFQPVVHQLPQAFPQTPVLLPQPQVPIVQSKSLPVPQQAVPYLQNEMPIQAFLEYQDLLFNPTHPFYPVTEPFVPVYNPVTV